MITAKVKLTAKAEHTEGNVGLAFNANYRDDEGNLINQEWAYATPHCSVSLTVNAATGELFEEGQTYTLSFEKDEGVPHGKIDESSGSDDRHL